MEKEIDLHVKPTPSNKKKWNSPTLREIEIEKDTGNASGLSSDGLANS